MNLGALDFRPHPAQKTIDDCFLFYKYIVVVCGRRFGKTMYWINKLVKQAWIDPGLYFYVLPTTKQAKRVAWKMLQKAMPDPFLAPKWKNESELWVENLRGGRVMLLGSDNPENLRGDKLKGVVLDEFADQRSDVFSILEPALGDEDGFCVFSGTPKGYNHFYEVFIKDVTFQDLNHETILGKTIDPDPLYKSFTFKTSDNPYFPTHRIEQAKKNLTDEMYRQEYLASFENFTGLIYKEFVAQKDKLLLEPIYNETGQVIGCKKPEEGFESNGKITTIIKDILFQPYWKYYLGTDTGRFTACLFVAIDEHQNEYVFEEIFNVDGLVKDIAKEIKQKINGKTLTGAVIDSASQVKLEYRAQGINHTDSKKDVLGSIEMMRSKMKNEKYFVLKNCKQHNRELSARKWSEKKKITIKGKKKNVPEEGNDHTINAKEYIDLTFLRHGSSLETPEEIRYKQSLKYKTIQRPVVRLADRG